MTFNKESSEALNLTRSASVVVDRRFPTPATMQTAGITDRPGAMRASGSGGFLRAQTPSTRQAGAYVKSLLGDDLHWKLVEEMDAIDSLMKDHTAKRQVAEKKLRQQEELSNQVQEAKRREADNRQSSQGWRQKLEADADDFKNEEQRKKEQSMLNHMKFQEDQTRLIQESQRRRLQEKFQLDQEAAELISLDKAALNKQVAADEKKKQFQQKVALEIADAAIISMKMKAEQKRKDAEEDVQLMRVQAAILEQRDRDRQRSRDEVLAKQTRNQQVYQASAGGEQRRLMHIEESKARHAMEERIKKEEDAHHEKIRKLKKLELDGRAFVAQQLEEQKAQRAREREENLHCRELSDKDAEAAAHEQKNKDQSRRDREKANQEFLKMQMLQKSGKLNQDQMTDIEQSLNKDRLERARDEEKLRILFESKQSQYRATRALNPKG